MGAAWDGAVYILNKVKSAIISSENSIKAVMPSKEQVTSIYNGVNSSTYGLSALKNTIPDKSKVEALYNNVVGTGTTNGLISMVGGYNPYLASEYYSTSLLNGNKFELLFNNPAKSGYPDNDPFLVHQVPVDFFKPLATPNGFIPEAVNGMINISDEKIICEVPNKKSLLYLFVHPLSISKSPSNSSTVMSAYYFAPFMVRIYDTGISESTPIYSFVYTGRSYHGGSSIGSVSIIGNNSVTSTGTNNPLTNGALRLTTITDEEIKDEIDKCFNATSLAGCYPSLIDDKFLATKYTDGGLNRNDIFGSSIPNEGTNSEYAALQTVVQAPEIQNNISNPSWGVNAAVWIGAVAIHNRRLREPIRSMTGKIKVTFANVQANDTMRYTVRGAYAYM